MLLTLALGIGGSAYAAVPTVLGAAAFAAYPIPALRDARVNPMSALRADQP